MRKRLKNRSFEWKSFFHLSIFSRPIFNQDLFCKNQFQCMKIDIEILTNWLHFCGFLTNEPLDLRRKEFSVIWGQSILRKKLSPKIGPLMTHFVSLILLNSEASSNDVCSQVFRSFVFSTTQFSSYLLQGKISTFPVVSHKVYRFCRKILPPRKEFAIEFVAKTLLRSVFMANECFEISLNEVCAANFIGNPEKCAFVSVLAGWKFENIVL